MKLWVALFVLSLVYLAGAQEVFCVQGQPCVVPPGTQLQLVAEHDGAGTTEYRLYVDTVIRESKPVTSLENGTIQFMLALQEGTYALRIAAVGAGGTSTSETLTITIGSGGLIKPSSPVQLRFKIATPLHISYVAGAVAEATTLEIPAHQADDLLIGVFTRSGSSSAPNLPAGWSQVAVHSGISRPGTRVAWRRSDGKILSVESSASTAIAVAIYRNAEVGRVEAALTGNSGLLTLPPIETTNRAWALMVGAHSLSSTIPRSLEDGEDGVIRLQTTRMLLVDSDDITGGIWPESYVAISPATTWVTWTIELVPLQ